MFLTTGAKGSTCLDTRLAKYSTPDKVSITSTLDKLQHKYALSEDFLTLVTGIMETETHFKHDSVSSAGAVGLMQLMPGATKDAKAFCALPKSFSRMVLVQNIELGVCYLRLLQTNYHFSRLEAAMAYNGGARTTHNFQKRLRIPRETLVYSLRVIAIVEDCKKVTP